MLCSRCVLPLLSLYMLVEQISAAVLPRKPKREADWPDHEVFPHLADPSDTGDLSVGDAGEARRVVDDLPEVAVVVVATPPASTQGQNPHSRKASDKRRKVAPLDSIGRFQIPSSRNRKEKKHVYGEN